MDFPRNKCSQFLVTAGRPPAWNPFRAQNLSAWTEPVVLATKDRVSLPVAVRNLLDLECPGRLIADMAEPGVARLLTEADFASVHDALVAAAQKDSSLALAALDRFQAVPVTAECRLVLSVALRSHLDAIREPLVRLVVEGRCLALWSEAAWQSGRADRLSLISSYANSSPRQ